MAGGSAGQPAQRGGQRAVARRAARAAAAAATTPDVPIEPIAMRVPVECLYVRFGNFPNFLWLRHRMEDWGGELRDVISERGLDYGLNDRMQKQLGIARRRQLAEVLGDKVIADVAMIGTDTSSTKAPPSARCFTPRATWPCPTT